MNRFIYISNNEWFENSSLKNPVTFPDHKIEELYPSLNNISYDLKLLVTSAPSQVEKSSPFYNNYRELYGSSDINSLSISAINSPSKNIFLNGFNQEHFEYIIPFIKNKAEILYLFKCPKINNLSVLSQLQNLKCLYIYWNNSIENLWDMKHNLNLKILSFIGVTKLKNINTIHDSFLEYICFDSSDNNGNKKNILFDASILNKIPTAKHLTIKYNDCNIDF